MTEQFLSVAHPSDPPPASHARSSSFRNRPRPKLSLDIDARPRSDSVPQIFLNLPGDFLGDDHDDHEFREFKHASNDGSRGGLCRVRSFKKTSKGIVNEGDKFKSKSTNSLMSGGSFVNLVEHGAEKRPSRAPSVNSLNSSSSTAPSYFRVMVLGAVGVGKSTLVRQFMTSENIGPYEPKTPIGEPQTTVSVLLDEEESILEFVDHTKIDDIETVKPDCFLVVFSLIEISSFELARKLVRHLRVDLGNDRAIILVGNKADLVRRRHISEHDAIALAAKYDCKYAETSIALNHNIDELIVGILSQIRLRLSPLRDKSRDKARHKMSKPRRAMTNILSKIFKHGARSDAQRCEDLFS